MKIYTEEFLLDKVLEIQKPSLEKLRTKKQEWYRCFEIPKKGGERTICALTKGENGRKLERLQKNLLCRFLGKIPIAVCAKGFVKGESYQSFLEPHMGNRYFLRLDIRDFFGSFSRESVRKGLKEFVEDEAALDTVCDLCTWEDVLPQGAVTSPVLSNILFRRTDQRILKYCQAIAERCRRNGYHGKTVRDQERDSRGWNTVCYTRYADDMLFSSDFFDFSKEAYFIKMISRILKEHGFELNRGKTAVSQGRIVLNGYVVEKSVWLSRKKLRDLKRILYFFKRKDSQVYSIDKDKVRETFCSLKELNEFIKKDCPDRKSFGSCRELEDYLAGCRSWLIAVLRIKAEDAKKQKNLKKLQGRTEALLQELNRAYEETQRWAENG